MIYSRGHISFLVVDAAKSSALHKILSTSKSLRLTDARETDWALVCKSQSSSGLG